MGGETCSEKGKHADIVKIVIKLSENPISTNSLLLQTRARRTVFQKYNSITTSCLPPGADVRATYVWSTS